jgi:mRNA-degrading endonuclease RelE of RelBE toxin-antitoxin system
MVKFFSTEPLRASIHNYLKKDEYLNCKKDLCDFFKEKSIQEICSNPILITTNNGFSLIKSRLLNSCFSKGKSGGYRLYYFVDSNLEHVYPFGFYPKTGKYGREDLTKTELKILIKNFNEEKKKGLCKEHDINNEWAIIKKEEKKAIEKK